MKRTFLTVTPLLIGALFCPPPASAQIEEVKLGVDGLTCILCAAGLEKSLRKIDGVSKVEISVEDEAALVSLKPGRPFNAESFKSAVKNAGQQLRSIELQISGAVRAENGRYTLQPAAGDPVAIEPQSALKLKPFVGRTVRAKGLVKPSQQARLELELTDVTVR